MEAVPAEEDWKAAERVEYRASLPPPWNLHFELSKRIWISLYPFLFFVFFF